MKLFKKKEKEEKKRNKKTIVRSEDISKDGVGDDELEDKIVSAYIPQRRAKRLGRSILRLDRLSIWFLSLTLVVAIIFIFAFMQEKMGNFTINLNRLELFRKGVTISDDSVFTKPTARLTANAISDATNISIADLPADINEIDGDHNGDNYVAYTYYIRNAGKEDVAYNAAITLDSYSKNADEAVRVIVYHNDERTVYAKEARDGSPEPGTTPFVSQQVVCEYRNEDFLVGNVDKYTIVIFLEGDDPECVDAIIGGSLQFSMNIYADDESATSLFVKWVQDIIDTITDNDSINASGTDAPDFYIRNQDITWENRRNGPNNIYEDQDKTPTTNSEQLKESLGDLTDKIKEDINEK
ncbi:MAG: hypothetical protein ACI32B_07235 [Erysipelotrichaceae bacterium]|nr:hypothetical protein [Erysipelotrichaceae bacterium]MDY5653837.1 hypothetical protein [Erysipelotrichaceae bacterium]